MLQRDLEYCAFNTLEGLRGIGLAASGRDGECGFGINPHLGWEILKVPFRTLQP